MSDPAVAIIVPTLNGERTLPALLAALARTARQLPLEIIAIDSGSTDATPGLLAAAGARVLGLEGARFGHGSARNKAAATAAAPVLVFVTQDVEPAGDGWLAPMLEALGDTRVGGVFGRQLPRGASPEETFLAAVNYPALSRRITPAALKQPFGPGSTLFSSAFGAMRREVWQRFPFPGIVMSEDQAWGLAVLRAGMEICYAADAEVYHGHSFTLSRAFRRNFDSGSSLQTLGLAGGAWRTGLGHLAGELRWIGRHHGAAATLRAAIYETVRMTGFQLGRAERLLPRRMARLLGEAPR